MNTLFDDAPETPDERRQRVADTLEQVRDLMADIEPHEFEITSCPCCQGSVQAHRHSLSSGLLAGLKRLGETEAGEANLEDLSLTRNQWDNFQKLRYWDLVEPVKVNGKGKTGIWKITSLGRTWLNTNKRQAGVHKTAVTFRGERIRYEGPLVIPGDVDPEYRRREDYGRDSQAPGTPGGDDDGSE